MPFNESGIWKPNLKQEKFIQIPDTVKEAAYLGGAGSGKTELLLMLPIVRGWYKNARFKHVFLRRTTPELRNEVWPRSKEIYPKFGAVANETHMTWTFPSGAITMMGHCEHEKDVHQYDSMQITLFTPDELTSLSEYIYLYIALQRVRSADPKNLPALVRATGMPGNIGHTWVNKRFVAPYPAGGKIIIGRAGVKRIFIHATVKDNKEHTDPTYMQSLEAIPDVAERNAKLYGSFDAYLGQVFDEFRDRKLPDEPDNAIHVVEPFDIPDWWPKFVIGDWGFKAMTYIGFYAVSPNRRLYLYRELYWYQTKIAEWGQVLKQFAEKEHPVIIKFCKSASQERGQEHTIQQQIEEILGRGIELTTNSNGSRVAGKMLVHEYLRWKQLPKPPIDSLPDYDEERALWLLRNRGMTEYKSYLAQYDLTRSEENNIPKLQIMRCSEESHDGHPNCCPIMIAAIKSCSYGKSKNNKPAEDVEEFDGDDPYDDLRYACDNAENYFELASEEFRKIEKKQKYIEQVEENKDFTAFYRNMRAVEAEDDIKAVTRFHKARNMIGLNS